MNSTSSSFNPCSLCRPLFTKPTIHKVVICLSRLLCHWISLLICAFYSLFDLEKRNKMDFLCHDSSHGALICALCQYAIISTAIAAHLRSCHKAELAAKEISDCVRFFGPKTAPAPCCHPADTVGFKSAANPLPGHSL